MKIVLIGFMGSGKSTVATELAKILNLKLVETDEAVLLQSGRVSIKEIFAKDGEVKFREMEMIVAKKLGLQNNVVISTGGGMVVNKLCIDYLKQDARIIYLKASFQEIEKRLQGDTTRPLFLDKMAAKKLFLLRKCLYKMYADMTINTDGKSVQEIINLVIKSI